MKVEKPEWYDEGNTSVPNLSGGAEYTIDDVEYPLLHAIVRPANGAKYLDSDALKQLAVHLYHLALWWEQEDARKSS
jgi:hypothetical protein